ncbi:3-hydroxybutyrate dehydrogenase [Actinopolyspora erythraea]|uniref:3-hydroxybutyrate dehydrogenase n=1 Tax=Actinopolyspora erythraea TaxID=414996 RepID=A0A099D840_9ACTN|nr:3-hydroxybutyrate dehydrogenase [Actinopolyspora erythraea]ASU80060.1 3-hydroxybutyrate dehydrogenase [Actinopolyspora erythraea]KGI82209.1 3-hydroxybutyrate dehydrogenase [Actinopolyspora erythraea]
MGDSSATGARPSAEVTVDLAGKRALVTGAGSGIGAAVARKLAATGAELLLVDRVAESVEQVAEETGAHHTVADLSEPDTVAELGENTDIVINNAGLQYVAPVHQYPPEMFQLLLTVMVQAPFRIIRAALPGMYRNGWGRIVNISSVHGIRAAPLKSAYVTAKHGLEGLSKTVALEAAGHGVTSNCVCPGYVRTPLVERQVSEHAVRHRVPRAQVVEDVLLSRTPIKRLVEPEEVAELTAWLCGPSAVSITGSSFELDGGWSAQ